MAAIDVPGSELEEGRWVNVQLSQDWHRLCSISHVKCFASHFGDILECGQARSPVLSTHPECRGRRERLDRI